MGKGVLHDIAGSSLRAELGGKAGFTPTSKHSGRQRLPGILTAGWPKTTWVVFFMKKDKWMKAIMQFDFFNDST